MCSMQLHHVEGLNRLEVRNNLEVVDGKELVYLSGNSGRTLGVVSKWQKLQLKSFFFVFQLYLYSHFNFMRFWLKTSNRKRHIKNVMFSENILSPKTFRFSFFPVFFLTFNFLYFCTFQLLFTLIFWVSDQKFWIKNQKALRHIHVNM